MIPTPYLAIGSLVAIALAGWKGYDLGYDVADAKHLKANAIIERQAQEAAEASRKAAEAKEAEWLAQKDTIEKENADALAKINGLRIANGRLVAATGGLFDRSGRAVSRNDVPANPGTAGGTSGTTTGSGCVLAGETSDFVLESAYAADKLAAYARTCRAWVLSIK